MLHTLLQFCGLARSRVKHKRWEGCSGGWTTSTSPPHRAQTPACGYVLKESVPLLARIKPAELREACSLALLSMKAQNFSILTTAVIYSSTKALQSNLKQGSNSYQTEDRSNQFPSVWTEVLELSSGSKETQKCLSIIFWPIEEKVIKKPHRKKPHSLPFCLALQHV